MSVRPADTRPSGPGSSTTRVRTRVLDLDPRPAGIEGARPASIPAPNASARPLGPALDAVLRCENCHHERRVTVDWLTAVTAARPTGQKGAALARAVALLPRLKCSACGSRAVWLRAVVDGRQAAFEASDAARTCAGCGNPIPPGRVAAVPRALRCRPCQERLEAGGGVEQSRPRDLRAVRGRDDRGGSLAIATFWAVLASRAAGTHDRDRDVRGRERQGLACRTILCPRSPLQRLRGRLFSPPRPAP